MPQAGLVDLSQHAGLVVVAAQPLGVDDAGEEVGEVVGRRLERAALTEPPNALDHALANDWARTRRPPSPSHT